MKAIDHSMADSNSYPGGNKTLQFGPYIAALFDLLGQRSNIARLENLPTNESEATSFRQVIADSLGIVHFFRKSFLEYFDEFRKHNPSLPEAPQIPNIDTAYYNQVKSLYEASSDTASVSIQTFGDTLIIFAPLVSDDEMIRWRTVYGILGSAATLMPVFLSTGHAFRGGIEINVGVELRPGELYGPALRDVYELESVQAKYPRILIGRQLGRLISRPSEQSAPTAEERVESILAKSCEAFIGRDLDGRLVIDYADEDLLTTLPNDHRALLRRGARRAEDAVNNFHLPEQTRARYQLCCMLSYIRSRKTNK